MKRTVRVSAVEVDRFAEVDARDRRTLLQTLEHRELAELLALSWLGDGSATVDAFADDLRYTFGLSPDALSARLLNAFAENVVDGFEIAANAGLCSTADSGECPYKENRRASRKCA